MLRVDNCIQAQPTMILFSRDSGGGAPDKDGVDAASAAVATNLDCSNANTNLHDMQCLWYEHEIGRSYSRQGNYGRALRYFLESVQHFVDISDDQFDFHNYCLRKNGLVTYMTMLRLQDRIYSHKFYRRASKDAMKTLCLLLDQKKIKTLTGGGDGADGEGGADGAPKELTAAEKKKNKHAAKRAQKKQEAAKEEAKVASSKTNLPCTLVKTVDPNGDAFLGEMNMVRTGGKVVARLLRHATNDASTYVSTFKLLSRAKWNAYKDEPAAWKENCNKITVDFDENSLVCQGLLMSLEKEVKG